MLSSVTELLCHLFYHCLFLLVSVSGCLLSICLSLSLSLVVSLVLSLSLSGTLMIPKDFECPMLRNQWVCDKSKCFSLFKQMSWPCRQTNWCTVLSLFSRLTASSMLDSKLDTLFGVSPQLDVSVVFKCLCNVVQRDQDGWLTKAASSI